MQRTPPRLALWLLERWEQNSPLVGDLLEAFQGGRSPGWFWRQTLVAIAVAWMRGWRLSRRYMGPFCGGFAAQTAVVLILRRFALPPRGLWWCISIWGLFLAHAIACAALRDRITGRASIDLRRLLMRDLRRGDRRVVSCLLGWETFGHYLFTYCGFVCYFPLSLPELVATQAIWFLMDLTLPGFFQKLIDRSL